jgi:TPR repeat protein
VKWRKLYVYKRVLLAIGAALCLARNAGGQENAQPVVEFDKVDYLFGPTARQSRQKLPGEVSTGRLRFDRGIKVLSFIAEKGPSLSIPYRRIRDLALNDQSVMRSGALAAPALAPFLHQHKHFMTIRYVDEDGADRTALLQLDKANYKEISEVAQQEMARKSLQFPPMRKLPGGDDLGTYWDTLLKLTAAEVPGLQARATSGDPRAQLLLAMAYLGFGCEQCGLKPDDEQGVALARKAADQGYAMAQFWLGFMYGGGDGVAKDLAESCRWFQKAANQNSPDGYGGLAECYFAGTGVKQNEDEGFRLVHLAADAGSTLAQGWLGKDYLESKPTGEKQIEGYMWLELARQGGYDEGELLLAKEPQEIRSEVSRRVAEWNKRFAERAAAVGAPAVGTQP